MTEVTDQWLQIHFFSLAFLQLSKLEARSSNLKPCCRLAETVPLILIKVNQTKNLPVRQMCLVDQRQQ